MGSSLLSGHIGATGARLDRGMRTRRVLTRSGRTMSSLVGLARRMASGSPRIHVAFRVAPVVLLATSLLVPIGASGAPLGLPDPQPATVSIALDAPQQLFTVDQFGLRGVPDQQPPVLQEPDGSYLVFLNGGFGKTSGVNAGHVSLFTSPDLLSYTPVSSNPSLAQVVFGPSCDDRAPSCLENFDSNYVGGNAVFRASNGSDLLMIYNGVNTDFAGGGTADGYYAEIGIARSTDEGRTWSRTVDASGTPQAIVQGADPKPTASQAKGAVGTPQPTAIVAGDYIYVFYPYFPTNGSPDDGPDTIQVARAPMAQDGAPGTWTKYYNGSFDVEPGLRPGKGSQVVPSTDACNRPAQPSVAFSTYLNEYVLTFVCKGGWFFSTSSDLATWSTPTQFYELPGTGEFNNDQPTAENMVLVTPGNPSQVIGQSGYVLYAYTPQWGRVPHELWMRPFTFNRGLPEPIQRCPTPRSCV